MILPRIFILRFCLPALMTAASSVHGQSVVLWRNQTPPRGEWREETRIEVSGMTLKIGTGQQALDGSGALAFMETVEREYTTPNRQEAEVLASTLQGNIAILGQAREQMQGGPLLGMKLIGRREQNRWQFTAKDAKPTPAEAKAIADFSKRSDILAVWPFLYGTQPRRKGETWKADTAGLTKDAKVPLAIELSFTLVDVAEHNGTRCANIGVTGLIKVPFGANNAGSFKFEVQGDIWRDVRDLVDVDATLRGTVAVSGAPVNNPNAPAGVTMELSAPFTLTRSVKSVKP